MIFVLRKNATFNFIFGYNTNNVRKNYRKFEKK